MVAGSNVRASFHDEMRREPTGGAFSVMSVQAEIHSRTGLPGTRGREFDAGRDAGATVGFETGVTVSRSLTVNHSMPGC